jgi:hypothetical protein
MVIRVGAVIDVDFRTASNFKDLLAVMVDRGSRTASMFLFFEDVLAMFFDGSLAVVNQLVQEQKLDAAGCGGAVRDQRISRRPGSN